MWIKIFFLSAFVSVYSCSSRVVSLSRTVQGGGTEEIPTLSRVKVLWGHAKKLQIVLPEDLAYSQEKIFICEGQEIPYQIQERNFISFVSVRHKNPKPFTCTLKVSEEGQVKSYPLFEIVPEEYAFKKEYLNVDKKHINLSPQNLERWKREMAMQEKVYSSSEKKPYFKTNFTLPLNSVVTSPFGLWRIFNNQRDSRHLGTDFRAAVGVPVPASNRGKVVFSGDLFFNGKTVIIDHGMNIFTMYCHLSAIAVEPLDMVSSETIIGLAGRTGRVTGPHLHWGVKVNGHWVNGLAFADEEI